MGAIIMLTRLALAVAMALAVRFVIVPAFAGAPMACTVDQANEVIDHLAETRGEIPVLALNLAGGRQGLLIANPKGEFILLTRLTDGRGCILAIGEGMRPAKVGERFVTEQAP